MDAVTVTIDETQPLLGSHTTIAERAEADIVHGDSSNIVDFDPNGDPENPMEWPTAFKWSIVALLAFMAFTVTFTCICVVPVASRIVDDLSEGEGDRKSASVLLVTIWELGEAAGPLLIAPLSEIFGRYPVMNAANVLFIAATILAALSQSTPLFIAARALTGLAVASNVLNPAIVGDMFASEQRGSAMSMMALAPLIGGACGPAISGAIAQSVGWRQVLWMSAGLAGTCEVLFLTCFRETYKVPILRRKAAKLRDATGNASLQSAFDPGDDHQSWAKLWEGVMRPFSVLFGSGVLMAMSIFGSAGFAFFYVMSVTLPDILENIYGLSPALTGASMMSFSIGASMGVMMCNQSLDRIYVKLRDAHKGIGRPEYRIPLIIVGGFTLPLVVMAYGWITQLRLPVPFFLVSVSLIGFSMVLMFLPLMAYVVDAFGLYAASAMTGVIVLRCLMGTFLPLTTTPLVYHLGYGWGFVVLGAFSLCLAPIPVLIMRWGSHWRQWSKYSRDA